MSLQRTAIPGLTPAERKRWPLRDRQSDGKYAALPLASAA